MKSSTDRRTIFHHPPGYKVNKYFTIERRKFKSGVPRL
ncbi:hypothetical protein DCCM_4176 [Desulfocucumis palustris]|uniref:Uncharacterized protein n=1 Tax=Desulfocucumis palustris TaxID=1898651 RepID=A0A2L2XH66_9FIRM|nr:hypothetical protein DCCM_4176 [Desulfocucumis palustris]